MDVFDAIAKRHSYRGGYGDTPIPRSDLERIVQAGIQAPSGYNDQTTSFVIVDEPKSIAAISDVLDNERLKQAKAMIIVIMDPVGAGRDLNFGIEDYSAATENILLAVTALGYASVWIDGALKREGRARKVADLVDVPDNLEVRVVLPLGIPETVERQHEKKPFGERAWFGTYGG